MILQIRHHSWKGRNADGGVHVAQKDNSTLSADPDQYGAGENILRNQVRIGFAAQADGVLTLPYVHLSQATRDIGTP